MIAFKCKMCGGELNIIEGSNICECEFCGTQQTIPSADNDKKVNLFNRANRLRMNAEFDKAATVYASITAEFPEEAEAYWGLCLCKYGIEYVDDPLTGNKIPTCHRTLPESIMDDSDFDQACENADPESKKLYREEAKAIDRLQQDILNIVASEEPFDVFICYKETDEDGERTDDSVISQEIYDFLTEKGLKVFFARITLEDKLGQQYEPYIYAALHSAKVMLAVGTQFDYFDAVWVKNEWARYLDMMKTDKSKTLIPCYKGIDAYDMPREFKNLQALNMDKIGWKQDLIRGIEKLMGDKKEQSTESQDSDSKQISIYLKRLSIFLESKEWNKLLEYCEKIFDIDPENAQAYLAKELAERKCSNISDLAAFLYLHKPVESDSLKNARRFADTETKALLDDLDKQVITAKDYLKKKYADELKEQRSIPGWKEKKEKLEYVRERVDILMPRLYADSNYTIILNTDGHVLYTEVTDDVFNIFEDEESSCGNWTSRMRLLNVTPGFVYGAEISGGIVVTGIIGSDKFFSSYPGISRWQNIKDMREMFGYIYGVTEDGRVKVAGSLWDNREYRGQDRVEELTDISSIIITIQ